MNLVLDINNVKQEVSIHPGDTLLKTLRRLGYFGVKHGCETGECGACTVLLDGKPVNTCVMLAAQAEGHRIQTIEAHGRAPRAGLEEHAQACTRSSRRLWRAARSNAVTARRPKFWPQKSCSSAIPSPSEAEVREALSGVLCRCTGYLKPVQAVLRAAASCAAEQRAAVDRRSRSHPGSAGVAAGQGEGG